MDDHFLTRPATIRGMWIGGIAVLGVLVLLDLAVAHHPHFTLDAVFGFGAWFGFLSCIALIGIAQGLGMLLKRPDSFYERDDHHDR